MMLMNLVSPHHYQKNLLHNRLQITKLSTAIQNAILLHRQPEAVKANAGAVDPAVA